MRLTALLIAYVLLAGCSPTPPGIRLKPDRLHAQVEMNRQHIGVLVDQMAKFLDGDIEQRRERQEMLLLMETTLDRIKFVADVHNTSMEALSLGSKLRGEPVKMIEVQKR